MPFDNQAIRLSSDTTNLITEVRLEKYSLPGESWDNVHRRVAAALFPNDLPSRQDFYIELVARRACPAGRVLAGAGTDKRVTWWNCFVAPLLQDSMRTEPSLPGLGIMDALASVAYSMQMGGGVGTDFSPLRPSGGLVERLMASASGPIAFMMMWDAMCRTVMSAGNRRGAMMATLRCDHPDAPAFVRAKLDGGVLRMFNVSLLITDAFMRAVELDQEWELGHHVPPFDKSSIRRIAERGGKPWYVYEVVRAREFWQTIMETTYSSAEPGVIFIDRVNEMNNLWYCEDISCTNPCGEQPLPPDQNCNLSHVNLSRCVIGTPFSDDCRFDLEVIARVTRLLVRAADAVIDLSPVPTEAQRAEANAKRRIGLGVTGLANALAFVGARYGSPDSVEEIRRVMRVIRDSAYLESVQLAVEKEPFPAYDRDKYLAGKFVSGLPDEIRSAVADHGIRNALLLTVAPTGTVSIAQADNSSSGLEPVFLARSVRRKLEPDGSFSEHVVEDFGFRVYANVKFDGDLDAALADPLPSYLVTTADLVPEDHLVVQATVQKYIDSAVSKTINVPTDTPFDEFVDIYRRAYDLGCKGCTTYREVPDSGRGAVLTAVPKSTQTSILNRGDREYLPWRRERGWTQKIKIGEGDMSVFLTVNSFPDGRPGEVFVELGHEGSTTRAMANLWAMAMSVGLQYGVPVEVYVNRFAGTKFEPAGMIEGHDRIAFASSIGDYVGRELGITYCGRDDLANRTSVYQIVTTTTGRECPACGSFTLIKSEGCDRCTSCSYNKCG